MLIRQLEKLLLKLHQPFLFLHQKVKLLCLLFNQVSLRLIDPYLLLLLAVGLIELLLQCGILFLQIVDHPSLLTLNFQLLLQMFNVDISLVEGVPITCQNQLVMWLLDDLLLIMGCLWIETICILFSLKWLLNYCLLVVGVCAG